MSDLLLSAETGRKEGTRPSRRLRREGKVPAVVYGLGGDPVAVSVYWPELRRCLTTDAGLNALITLDIDGANHLSVVKDIQRHPTRRDVLHVDFLRVTEDQQIEVNVPLVLVGEARNVTMYDGMVAEYEIVDRIESINQQLDYAQATMQRLKEDAQHHHSTFLEYTIVILLGFEVLVEMHAMGWIDLTPLTGKKRAPNDV